jgi:hypothetical protein
MKLFSKTDSNENFTLEKIITHKHLQTSGKQIKNDGFNKNITYN